MTRLVFLPGAGGSAHFWRPVADELTAYSEQIFMSWPGLGDEPHEPDVTCLEDLVEMVLSHMTEPVDLLAQSMGGLVALKVALKAPERVRRLVLVGTSGGIPVEEFGGCEWREIYRAEFPNAAKWITDIREDLSPRLSGILAATLLLWGAEDDISPPAVGQRLADVLPEAKLEIVQGGGHEMVQSHARVIAPLIAEFLG